MTFSQFITFLYYCKIRKCAVVALFVPDLNLWNWLMVVQLNIVRLIWFGLNKTCYFRCNHKEHFVFSQYMYKIHIEFCSAWWICAWDLHTLVHCSHQTFIQLLYSTQTIIHVGSFRLAWRWCSGIHYSLNNTLLCVNPLLSAEVRNSMLVPALHI